uniref:Ovule protein n=1 Tax=Elaeophora elaphi TaxID=1147741 RepID=A0A0R3S4F7_9BILA
MKSHGKRTFRSLVSNFVHQGFQPSELVKISIFQAHTVTISATSTLQIALKLRLSSFKFPLSFVILKESKKVIHHPSCNPQLPPPPLF